MRLKARKHTVDGKRCSNEVYDLPEEFIVPCPFCGLLMTMVDTKKQYVCLECGFRGVKD